MLGYSYYDTEETIGNKNWAKDPAYPDINPTAELEAEIIVLKAEIKSLERKLENRVSR